MNLSISESAIKGGDLGWLNENVISKKFRSKIVNTPVGNISEPILLPEGIFIFKVRDKKKIKRKNNFRRNAIWFTGNYCYRFIHLQTLLQLIFLNYHSVLMSTN